MEITSTTPQGTEKKTNFLHIPNLNSMVVGHAGLYEPEEEDTSSSIEAQVVDVRKLGANGCKVMLSIEEGIKDIAKELAKDKENGLPSSSNGIFVHYLVKGIEKDFNIVFNEQPYSTIIRRRTVVDGKDVGNKADKGVRVFSKKEKNEILAKTTWDYWSNLVSEGALTMEEAQKEMMESIEKRNEYEVLGYYFSKNKTEGLKLFNWKEIVESSVDCENPTKLYTFNKIQILVPNLMDEFYNPAKRVSKIPFIKEGLKTKLLPTLLDLATLSKIQLDFYYGDGKFGGMENVEISSMEDLTDYMGITDELKRCKINGVHLVKIAVSGMMKDRYVCFDISDKAGNRQLSLYDKQGAKITMQATKN
jgi:hypothetical protein